MIKAVIFDADGVLCTAVLRMSQRLAREYKTPLKELESFFEDEFPKCLIGKADLKEEVKPYLKKWRWEKSVDDFLDYWFKSEHEIDLRIKKIIELLRNKGIKCYLATNQEKYRTDYMLNQMNFKNLFDKVFSSAYLGYKKPQHKFFEKIKMNLKNIKKEEILFWDDKKDYVEAARKFGFKAEHYKSYEDFKRKLGRYI